VKQGVRDTVRLSDARMSSTSYGACILHVAPRNPVLAGRLALVRNGDRITLDVAAHSINLDVPEGRACSSAARMGAQEPRYERAIAGYSVPEVRSS
jgi:dihydroxyacid dehydratase/phosphogluconate dehydratase